MPFSLTKMSSAFFVSRKDDAMNVFEAVKGNVTTRQAAEMYWCCTIKVDIENSKGQYIEKDKQEATKDGSESTKIQHGI